MAIISTLVEGIRQRDPSIIVNSIVSLLFAALPRYLEKRFDIWFQPWQRLWVSVSAVVHTVGMVGPYDRIWWWDHLAHTLSGVVVAGATDVALRIEAEESGQEKYVSKSRPVVITGVTLGFGACWEILEYVVHTIADQQGVEPLLVHYGRLDAIGDVIFDLMGAGLVVFFCYFELDNIIDSTTNK